MKNPQAFPGTEAHWYEEVKNGETYHPGMSLRDYFAGQALAGILSHPETGGDSPQTTAGMSYLYADAMLKQREI